MYVFPEKYGGREMGNKVSRNDILEVAELAGIGDSPLDYLSIDKRNELTILMLHPNKIECKDLVEAYKFLKYSTCSLN